MRQDIVQQLKHFSEQRAELMQKLQTLDRQENRVLAQLMSIESRVEPLQRRLTHSANATAAPPPSNIGTATLTLPMPVVDFTSSQPEKTARKSLRPASASPKSTPSAAQLRTPRTLDRIAFAERTALGTSKATSLQAVRDAEASPTMLADETAEIATEHEEHERFEFGVTPLRRTRSMRVPTKFGDDEGSGTRNDERGQRKEAMITPAVRSTDKIRRVGTPARTPGSSKLYEVPHTVARKRWAF